MQNQPSKFLFIINPISGGKEKHNWEAAIRDYFKDRPQTIEIYILNGTDDKISIRHHIDSAKPDSVIAVGGDGTVRLVADILKETPLPLGIIPAGSANGMAKELDIPEDVEKALDIIVEGEVQKIDLIRINEEEICMHLSDIGLNAMLVKYFEQSKKRGMWGYGKAVFRVLWEKRKLRVKIETDEGTVKRYAYMVTIANARKYGTGANINPEGNIADGKFEVVVVRKLNVLEILKAIFTDRTFHPRHIEVFSTRNLDLQIHRQARFQIDGEYKGKTDHVQARILAGIINVIMPKTEQTAT